MPKISIILATYNEPRYLHQAIQSVLDQSYADFEFIVINDASPHPEIESIVKSFSDVRMQYYRNPENKGLAGSLNRGLSLAKGDLIARIDDDDVWIDPDKLMKQVSFLAAHPEVVLLGTNIAVTDFDTNERKYVTNYPCTDAEIRRSILKNSPFAHPSIVARKAAMLRAGGYSEQLKRLEDYDLWLRLGADGAFANLPDVAVLWRAPSRTHKNVAKNRYIDTWLKVQIMGRRHAGYPGFLAAYIRELFRAAVFFLLQWF